MPGPRAHFADVLGTCGTLIRRRGLTVLISDLLGPADEIAEGFKRLRYRGSDLLIFQVLDPAEHNLPWRGPVLLEDPESGTRYEVNADSIRPSYIEKRRQHSNHLRRAAADVQADLHVFNTGTPFGQALSAFFARRKRDVAL